ncbi:MAG: penicillin-binding protein [Deltaproteobacteria bacterium]|nr:penicillin-binding protein [Deltaproteobacteria bacterium]
MAENWRRYQESLSAPSRRRRRRRAGLLVLPVLLFGGYTAARVALHPAEAPPRAGSVEAPKWAVRPAEPRDLLAKIGSPRPVRSQAGTYEQWVDGNRVVYTLEPSLQELAVSVLRKYRVPYGALVAVEPATGRLIAMAEYSHEQPSLQEFCRRATYPAASLIKVVTASAALEMGKAGPETVFHFSGSPYRLNPRKLSPAAARTEGNAMTLGQALGASNNVVFAKVGADLVGAEKLEEKLRAFAFNRPIPLEIGLQPSQAVVPSDRYALGKTAAGFGEVRLSPVHAALIAAAVGNRGVMMQPRLVDHVEDASGQTVYRSSAATLAKCTSPEVAADLGRMMENTVDRGTSRRVFSRYARKLSQEVRVAGKTGSLNGDNPPGMYEWFIGFAPVENPKIAVASLIVNHDLWHIKGTYVAQEVMKEFFGM